MTDVLPERTGQRVAQVERPAESGFSPAEWSLLAACWHPVASSMELGEIGTDDAEPVRSVLLDIPLVVFRGADGTPTVLTDRCPHRGARLSGGMLADGCVACPYHGFVFDGAGRCVTVPSAPGTPAPRRMHLGPVPVAERFGLVWACLAPDADGPGPLPPWEGLEDPSFQRAGCRPSLWASSAQRHAENFNDQAHFPYIHADTFGADDAAVPPLEVMALDRLLSLDVDMVQWNRMTLDGPLEPIDVHYEYRWHLPFASWLRIEYPGQGTELIADVAAPVHADACRVYLLNARDFHTDDPVDDWVEFQDRVNAEDREIVETLEPRGVPIDLTEEVHVRADAMSIAARRWFRAQLALR